MRMPESAEKFNNSPLTHEVDPIDRYSALIVRGTIIGTGLLGLTLFVRNSRMFATYHHVQQIPEHIYRSGIPLKGIVREVTPNGWLRIEHRPALKLPRLLAKKQPKTPSRLNLRLAGLDVSPVGVQHLTNELKVVGRPVYFSVIKPIEKQPDGSDAEVTVKKTLRSVNLNMELVRKGYARVLGPDNPESLNALQFNSNYSRLITRLLTCEKVAEEKGLGLWERSTWVEKLASFPSTATQMVANSTITKFIVLACYMLYDLWLVFLSLAKNLFYIGQALASYSLEGYRRFSRFVDNLSRWYFGRKRGSNAIQAERKG